MERTPEKLRFDLTFLDGRDGSAESAATTAALRIFVGDVCLTRNANRWERRAFDETFVSGYPLAAWLASSWWRLRWEPGSAQESSSDWKLNHWISGANEGFLWPNIRFESAGEFIDVQSQSSPPRTEEMVVYESNSSHIIPGAAFESAIDEVISNVLERLDGKGLRHTELLRLWREVLVERNDPQLSKDRRLEAMAGFAAGELAQAAIQDLSDLEFSAGANASSEIAAACAGHNPRQLVKETLEQTKNLTTVADFPPPQEEIAEKLANEHPAVQGQSMAQYARRKFGISNGPITNNRLAKFLALRPNWTSAASMGRTVGLAVRNRDTDGVSLSFRRKSIGRRFEIARFLGDAIWSGNDAWLPATDSKTARQKRQRAFASEFLCPYEELNDGIPDYPTDSAIRKTAQLYEVSPLAIASQLVNHGRIGQEILAAYQNEQLQLVD